MYPIKARNGSVFEPNKAPSVGLTLGLLDRPFGLLKLRMFGQLDENPGKAEFSDSDGRIQKCCWIRTIRLNWLARQRLSEIRQDS